MEIFVMCLLHNKIIQEIKKTNNKTKQKSENWQARQELRAVTSLSVWEEEERKMHLARDPGSEPQSPTLVHLSRKGIYEDDTDLQQRAEKGEVGSGNKKETNKAGGRGPGRAHAGRGGGVGRRPPQSCGQGTTLHDRPK